MGIKSLRVKGSKKRSGITSTAKAKWKGGERTQAEPEPKTESEPESEPEPGLEPVLQDVNEE